MGSVAAVAKRLDECAPEELIDFCSGIPPDHRLRVMGILMSSHPSGTQKNEVSCDLRTLHVVDMAGNCRGTYEMAPTNLISDVARQLQLSAGMQVQLVYNDASLDLGKTVEDCALPSGATLTMVVVSKIDDLDDIRGKFAYCNVMNLPVVVGNIQGSAYVTLWTEPDYEAGYTSVSAKDGECVEILQVKSKPGAFAQIRCQEGEGWVSMDNLHVQIVTVGKGSVMPAGSFALKLEMKVVHGQTRDTGGGTALRHRPSNEQGSNFNKQRLVDGEIVTVKELAGRDGSPGGFHWALVENLHGKQRGWIMTRNLHVQLVWAS